MNTYLIYLPNGKVLEIQADYFRIDDQEQLVFHGQGIDNSELHLPADNLTVINKNLLDKAISEQAA